MPSATDISTLESHLWEAANILLLEWTQKFEDVRDRAHVVSLKDIENEDWTLNISRCVLPPIGEDIPPLDVAIADFKAAWTRAQEAEAKLRDLLQENGLLEGEQ